MYQTIASFGTMKDNSMKIKLSCSFDHTIFFKSSMWYKRFVRNVWKDFRLLMSALETVPGKNLNDKFTAKMNFPNGYFISPMLMLSL